MKIHEYQAKEIFRRFGVPTPRGEMVTTPDQARAVAEKLGTKIVVVKAQIHAGGRGKAGGVKLAKSPAEAADLAKTMLGMKLVTPQTGPAGRIVQRLLIEEGLDIKRELYLSILVDRAVAAHEWSSNPKLLGLSHKKAHLRIDAAKEDQLRVLLAY